MGMSVRTRRTRICAHAPTEAARSQPLWGISWMRRALWRITLEPRLAFPMPCVCVCVCVCVLFVLHLLPPRTGMHVHAESSETVGLEPAGRGPSVGYRRLGKQHQAPVQRGSARVCATLAMTACGTERGK